MDFVIPRSTRAPKLGFIDFGQFIAGLSSGKPRHAARGFGRRDRIDAIRSSSRVGCGNTGAKFMAEALAYVSATHQDPPSTATTGFHLVVQYDGKDTLLYVPLKEPLAAHQPHEEAIAAEFRELAAALLRIAENPKAILPRDPARG